MKTRYIKISLISSIFKFILIGWGYNMSFILRKKKGENDSRANLPHRQDRTK